MSIWKERRVLVVIEYAKLYITRNFRLSILKAGTKVSLPMFIDQGEMIKIDTRTGEYMERA